MWSSAGWLRASSHCIQWACFLRNEFEIGNEMSEVIYQDLAVSTAKGNLVGNCKQYYLVMLYCVAWFQFIMLVILCWLLCQLHFYLLLLFAPSDFPISHKALLDSLMCFSHNCGLWSYLQVLILITYNPLGCKKNPPFTTQDVKLRHWDPKVESGHLVHT